PPRCDDLAPGVNQTLHDGVGGPLVLGLHVEDATLVVDVGVEAGHHDEFKVSGGSDRVKQRFRKPAGEALVYFRGSRRRDSSWTRPSPCAMWSRNSTASAPSTGSRSR